MIRELLTRDKFTTDPALFPWPEFVVRGGTIWLLDRWMNQDKATDWNKYKVRHVKVAAVTDFDTDKQLEKVLREYQNDVYTDLRGILNA